MKQGDAAEAVPAPTGQAGDVMGCPELAPAEPASTARRLRTTAAEDEAESWYLKEQETGERQLGSKPRW